MRHGLVTNPLLHISESLGVMPLCMSQKRKEASWIVSMRNGSSLDTKMEDYKTWNSLRRKTICSRGVIFKEVGETSRNEDEPR